LQCPLRLGSGVTIPSPWHAAILALAAFRICRLVGWDDFPPVSRARAWLTGETSSWSQTDQIQYEYRRPLLAHFLGCAFCQGFWTTVAVWGTWEAAPRWTLIVAVPFALSSAVGLVAKNLDP
jgi:hypothetical protein